MSRICKYEKCRSRKVPNKDFKKLAGVDCAGPD